MNNPQSYIDFPQCPLIDNLKDLGDNFHWTVPQFDDLEELTPLENMKTPSFDELVYTEFETRQLDVLPLVVKEQSNDPSPARTGSTKVNDSFDHVSDLVEVDSHSLYKASSAISEDNQSSDYEMTPKIRQQTTKNRRRGRKQARKTSNRRRKDVALKTVLRKC